MKNVLTIIKKEFARFFKDRRMVITVLMPGLLIYVLYSIMGAVFSKLNAVDEDYKPATYLVNAPLGIEEGFSEIFDLKKGDWTLENALSYVEDGTLDLCVEFKATEDGIPKVNVYYNSEKGGEISAYTTATFLDGILNKPDFQIEISDVIAGANGVADIISSIVPMLMFCLLSAACISVAPESIAGEKERGTMATMLITPVRRVEIALGKIISLTVFALLSGISSFIGVILSLPKLMSGAIGAEAVSMYGAGDYFIILAIIISVVLVIISAFSVLSAYAKSVKEASTMIAPLMIVIMLLGMVSMFFTSTPHWAMHLIPLVGSGLAMSSILSLNASALGIGLSILSNLIFATLLVVLLAFMFKSERIMFKK